MTEQNRSGSSCPMAIPQAAGADATLAAVRATRCAVERWGSHC